MAVVRNDPREEEPPSTCTTIGNAQEKRHGPAANAIASHAALKAYLGKREVESVTATRAVSIHLALTVARKGSTTGDTRRRRSPVGDARNAPGRQRSQTPELCAVCDKKIK